MLSINLKANSSTRKVRVVAHCRFNTLGSKLFLGLLLIVSDTMPRIELDCISFQTFSFTKSFTQMLGSILRRTTFEAKKLFHTDTSQNLCTKDNSRVFTPLYVGNIKLCSLIQQFFFFFLAYLIINTHLFTRMVYYDK